MTKRILLFGKIRSIEVEDTLQNREVVMDIRQDVKKLDDMYSFDLYVDDNDYIVATYHYDYVDLNLEADQFNVELTRLVTGEGVNDFELPYPIADVDNKKYDFTRFADLWLKNNAALGGSLGIKLVNAQATFTGMLVAFKLSTV